uniref:Uncharacterized protein n=1 Tax=Panagrolaimus davidi TaxID=227884 RepID=A0A914QBD3_9BILA
MLNWDSIDEIYILFNPFICNCSMAWLINDFAYSNPKFVTHMKLDEPYMFNQTLKCAAPKELKDKTFKEISNKLCNTSFTEPGIFERLETKIPPSNFSFLMATIFIIFGILISGLIIFIFNRRKRKPLENVSTPEETEKLNDEIVLNDL